MKVNNILMDFHSLKFIFVMIVFQLKSPSSNVLIEPLNWSPSVSNKGSAYKENSLYGMGF